MHRLTAKGMNYQLMNRDLRTRQMVERVEWMAPIHYEILMFFDNHDIWISPRDLSKNIGYDNRYASRECKKLLKADLLIQDGQTYHLSDRGREFLDGELDPEELEDPTED